MIIVYTKQSFQKKIMNVLVNGEIRNIYRVESFCGGSDISDMSVEDILNKSHANKLFHKEIEKRVISDAMAFFGGTDTVHFPSVNLQPSGVGHDDASKKRVAVQTELLYAKRASEFGSKETPLDTITSYRGT